MTNTTPRPAPKMAPDTPGRWLFTGRAWLDVLTDNQVELKAQPFDAVMVSEQLTICDVGDGKPYVVQQFIGWWVKDTGNLG